MLDGKIVAIEQLKETAKNAILLKQKIVAMISADKSAEYNSVVTVMDALRTEGVSDFALQLDPIVQKK